MTFSSGGISETRSVSVRYYWVEGTAIKLDPLNGIILNLVQQEVGIIKFSLLYLSVPVRFYRGSANVCRNGAY